MEADGMGGKRERGKNGELGVTEIGCFIQKYEAGAQWSGPIHLKMLELANEFITRTLSSGHYSPAPLWLIWTQTHSSLYVEWKHILLVLVSTTFSSFQNSSVFSHSMCVYSWAPQICYVTLSFFFHMFFLGVPADFKVDALTTPS